MTAADVEMTDAAYHRHRALSASGAKLLLPPNCPAIYRWYMDNPRPTKAAFDLGHAAHKLVLGAGAPIEVIQVTAKDGTKSDALNRMTNSAKDHEKAIRAAGGLPLLREDFDAVHAMAKRLREHRLASALLSGGKAEQTLFWLDDLTGSQLRGRIDWLPDAAADRMILPDYKSAISAAPEKFSRSLTDYGYVIQAAFYTEAVLSLGLAEQVVFLNIVQEKTPPYLVAVYQPDDEAMEIGRQMMRQAVDIYAECNRTGIWPGYSDDIELISVAPWVARQFQESESA